MKKRNATKKLNLNKETISNLKEVKGGAFSASHLTYRPKDTIIRDTFFKLITLFKDFILTI